MTEYIHIKRREGARDVLFVFSHVDFDRGAFAFWKIASHSPTHIVHVNTAGNAWYHNGIPDFSNDVASTAEGLRRIARDLDADQVYTFGASMGGYAAALFGCLLQARRVLMVSAETVLGLPGSRSEYYGYSAFDRAYMDLGELIRTRCSTEFIWWLGEDDPVDLLCAARSTCRHVVTYTLPGCGHLAARRMNDEGLLTVAVRGLVADHFPHIDFRAYRSIIDQPPRDLRDLYAFFRIHVVSAQRDPQARYDEVSQAIQQLYPDPGDQHGYHLHLARVFEQKGNHPASAIANSAAIQADATNPEAYRSLARALEQQGKLNKAARAQRRAKALVAAASLASAPGAAKPEACLHAAVPVSAPQASAEIQSTAIAA